MVGKRHAIIIGVFAVDFPGASVSSDEQVLVRTLGLLQATGDGSDL
jgi:hypothetical protein